MAFNPSKYGATPVSTTSFNPSKYGATPVVSSFNPNKYGATPIQSSVPKIDLVKPPKELTQLPSIATKPTAWDMLKTGAKSGLDFGINFAKGFAYVWGPQQASYLKKVVNTDSQAFAKATYESGPDWYKEFWKHTADKLGIDKTKADAIKNQWNQDPLAPLFNTNSDLSPYTDGKQFTIDTLETLLNTGLVLVGSSLPATSFKGVVPATKAFLSTGATTLEKDIAKQAITTAAKKFFLSGTTDAILGGTYGWLEAERDNKPLDQAIKENILPSASFGLLFPLAFGAITGGTSKVLKTSLKEYENFFSGMAEKTKPKSNIAEAIVGQDRSGQLLSESANGITGQSPKLHSFYNYMANIPAKIEDKWLDQFSYARRFQKQIETSLGRPLTDEENVYVRAHLTDSQSAFYQNQLVKDWISRRNKSPEVDALANEYLRAKGLLGDISQGKPTPDGMTEAGLQERITQLESHKKSTDIIKTAKDKRDFFNKLLQNEVTLGIQDPKLVTDLTSREWYDPHRVGDFYTEEMALAAQKNKKSISTREGGIQTRGGTERSLLPIDESAQQYIGSHVGRVRSDFVTSAVFKIHDVMGDNSPMIKIRDAGKVKLRLEYAQKLNQLREITAGLTKQLSKDKKENRFQRSALNILNKQIDKLTARLVEKTNTFFEQGDRYVPKQITEVLPSVTKENVISFEKGKNNVNRKSLGKIAIELTSTQKKQPIVQKKIEPLNERITSAQAVLEELHGLSKDLYTSIKTELADQKVARVDKVNSGYDTLSRIRDGIREDILMPKDVAAALKGSNQLGINPHFLNFLSWISGAKILRPLATTFSAAFSLFRNPLRDIQEASIVSPKGFGPVDWIKGFAAALKDKVGGTSSLYDNAAKNGALTGFFEETKLDGATRRGIQIKPAKKSLFSYGVDVASSPLKILQAVGQSYEEATRIAVFRSSLEAGYSPLMAANNGRNSTVNFTKMGTWMKFFNTIVPFLNASTQGLVNQAVSAAKDPYRYGRKQLYFSVYPTLTLYANNSRYASYYTIDDTTKKNEWIIMVGETQGVDDNGNVSLVPHYVHISKPVAAKVISSTIERFFDVAANKDPENIKDFLTGIIGTQSPVDYNSILPPMLSTIYGLKSNYDLFTQKEVVPQYLQNLPVQKQSKPGTEEIYKKIGEMLNVSPLQVKYVSGRLFAGAGRDVVSTADILLNANSEAGFKKVSNDPFNEWSKIPVLRSILSTANYRISPTLKNAEQYAATRKADLQFQIDEQTKKYIKDRDIHSLQLYFQKNADAFLSPLELKGAITRTLKKLIEQNVPKTEYSKLPADALYYLYSEDIRSGAKDMKKLLEDLIKQGVPRSTLNSFIPMIMSDTTTTQPQ